MKISAMILAAGNGSRMNSKVKKQFMEINGLPIIWYALDTFQKSPVDEIVLVTSEEDIEFCDSIVKQFGFTKVKSIIAGGKERYDSVYNGLCEMETDYVLIHDGARPLISQSIIERCIKSVVEYNACVVSVPVKDTIKVVEGGTVVAGTPDRGVLWSAQTPQAFKYSVVKRAYDKLMELSNKNVTDDAMVVEKYSNAQVYVVEGEYSNIKITTPEDIWLAEKAINMR